MQRVCPSLGIFTDQDLATRAILVVVVIRYKNQHVFVNVAQF